MHTLQSYTINEAARAAGISVGTLRTWQRQGVIQNCGVEPRPSYPRVYPLAGVYEMALLRAMTGHGIVRSLAMHVVRDQIAGWLAVDDPKTPAVTKGANERKKRIMTELRDVARPVVLVIGADDSYQDNPIPRALEYADGWDHVAEAINVARFISAPGLLASQPGGGMNTAKPRRPIPIVHVVDITSVLAEVDARLSDASKS